MVTQMLQSRHVPHEMQRSASESAGKVLFAPLRLRLKSGKFREPDLVLLLNAADARRHNEYWDGADLVIEVVSPDDPDRDWITKRREYAQSGIAEYWIVDPRIQTLTVFSLKQGAYIEHGHFERSARATSALLTDFTVDVADVFDAR